MGVRAEKHCFRDTVRVFPALWTLHRSIDPADQYTSYFNTTPPPPGDWVMLIYRNGSQYETHCTSEGRKAIIMISCKPGILAVSVILEVGLLHCNFILQYYVVVIITIIIIIIIIIEFITLC